MLGTRSELSSDIHGISIAQITEHDLLEIVEIEEQSGLSKWGWAAYYAELQTGNRELMLIARVAGSAALEKEHIAGYIVAREASGELHINNVAVRDQYRRRGVGGMLLTRIIEAGRRRGAASAFLEVRHGNVKAQALYRRFGFKAIAQRPGYYSEPR